MVGGDTNKSVLDPNKDDKELPEEETDNHEKQETQMPPMEESDEEEPEEDKGNKEHPVEVIELSDTTRDALGGNDGDEVTDPAPRRSGRERNAPV